MLDTFWGHIDFQVLCHLAWFSVVVSLKVLDDLDLTGDCGLHVPHRWSMQRIKLIHSFWQLHQYLGDALQNCCVKYMKNRMHRGALAGTCDLVALDVMPEIPA